MYVMKGYNYFAPISVIKATSDAIRCNLMMGVVREDVYYNSERIERGFDSLQIFLFFFYFFISNAREKSFQLKECTCTVQLI